MPRLKTFVIPVRSWIWLTNPERLQMFQPQHTMIGFEIHDYPEANGSIHIRVLRTLLNKNFKALGPSLRSIMATALREEIEAGRPISNGSSITLS